LVVTAIRGLPGRWRVIRLAVRVLVVQRRARPRRYRRYGAALRRWGMQPIADGDSGPADGEPAGYQPGDMQAIECHDRPPLSRGKGARRFIARAPYVGQGDRLTTMAPFTVCASPWTFAEKLSCHLSGFFQTGPLATSKV